MNKVCINILLIDDDADDYLITEGLLADVNNPSICFKVDWCSDYQEALAAFHEDAYDVYLMDYHMGKHNGLEMLKEALRLGVQKPIIMLTGLGDVEVDTQAIQAGAADYLVKGQFSEDLLERSIRHAIERAQMQRALRESEERYALAAKGANDGLWDWKLSTGEIYFSSRWKAMLGFDEDELENRLETWFERIHADDKGWFKEAIDRHLEGESSQFEIEYRMQAKDGAYRRMLTRGLAVRNPAGKVYRMTGWQTDLSTRVASYDALTSLPNRSLFFERLNRAVDRRKWDHGFSYAVFFLDLDGFKMVNDSLGHAMGDSLLLEVASRLERSLRAGDSFIRYDHEHLPSSTVARFGGDEFAILLEGISDHEAACGVAERIQTALSQPYSVAGQQLFTTASIGIAIGQEKYDSVEDILRDSDIAMYSAKADGKARHAIFDNHMYGRIKERLSLENDLRLALDGGQFRLFYQPIVDLLSGGLVGFEALIRWQHPTKGLVSPNDFIPVAEDTGQIIAIGLWVIEEASRQLKAWHERFPHYQDLSVSVNLSSKQLAKASLFDEIVNILSRTGLEPKYLNFEVTETTILEHTDLARQILEQLRTLGCRVKIDDFGTGYSSLSRLHSMPLDVLKIDRSFVMNFLDKSDNAGIVETIIQLARTLKLEVVAEGIETQAQLQRLRSLGCRLGQGYLFASPKDTSIIEELLSAERLLVQAD
ncbi:MAG: EAL domain-containing protein [Trueperaceae bacterium]|nr:EAL domain-containing protein [Trueperaceae bacterium]